MFIPHDDWSHVGDDEYKAFALFGPQSFSMFEPRGEDVTIPRGPGSTDRYTYNDQGQPSKDARIILYEKALRTCVNDWKQVVTSGKIRMALKERAAGSRGLVFHGGQLKEIWEAIKLIGPTIKDAPVDKGKKRAGSEGPSTSKRVHIDLADIDSVVADW